MNIAARKNSDSVTDIPIASCLYWLHTGNICQCAPLCLGTIMPARLSEQLMQLDFVVLVYEQHLGTTYFCLCTGCLIDGLLRKAGSLFICLSTANKNSPSMLQPCGLTYCELEKKTTETKQS